MAKKKRIPRGPPAAAKKWCEEQRQSKHRGRKPTPAQLASIWRTCYASDRWKPATAAMIAKAEKRLEVAFPDSLKAQLLVQNGGPLAYFEPVHFEDVALWTNASVDWILSMDEWVRASDDHWFESVDDVDHLDRLIRIASHSESQLCLDYRRRGKSRQPAVTHIDVCTNPTEVAVVAPSVDAFIEALVSARRAGGAD